MNRLISIGEVGIEHHGDQQQQHVIDNLTPRVETVTMLRMTIHQHPCAKYGHIVDQWIAKRDEFQPAWPTTIIATGALTSIPELRRNVC